MNKVILSGVVFFLLGLNASQFSHADEEAQNPLPVLELNRKHLNFNDVRDVILVQTEATPRKTYINKSCTKSREVCEQYSQRYICRTEWRNVCRYHPYHDCWNEPVTVCGWETYCSRWGTQYYTATKDVRVIIKKDAKLHYGQDNRHFVLSCGAADTSKVFLTPMANDVRVKRGFWRTNTFKVKDNPNQVGNVTSPVDETESEADDEDSSEE